MASVLIWVVVFIRIFYGCFNKIYDHWAKSYWIMELVHLLVFFFFFV